MASNIKRELLETTALTATTTGVTKTMENGLVEFLGYLNVSANNGATVVTATIEHSPDGVVWLTAGSFAVVTNTTGQEAISILKLFPLIRAKVVLAGVSATVQVLLFADRF